MSVLPRIALALSTVLALCACKPGREAPRPAYEGAIYAPVPGRPTPSVATLTALGRSLFFDAGLSASGRTSCASCHDPAHAFGPPNDLAVQLAGPDGRTPGVRAVPSLRYLQTVPPFSEHHFDNDGNDSIDAGPTGGTTWDGRAGSAHEQAALPLLSDMEMANGTVDRALARLAHSGSANAFKGVFGEDIFQRPKDAMNGLLLAFEVFQQTPAEFYPYTSRYDRVLRGEAKLSPREARGLALFNDPDKGNCASCHISEPTPDGAFPLFTDYGHIALGVPRSKTADPAWHDLGLCGPLRTDFSDRPDYCGLFRTPSLRNVAVRRVFFHNGAFGDLAEVVRFYAQRDTSPERFYPRDAQRRVMKFDDLPATYDGNVNQDPPFGRRPGDKAALTEPEIADIVAFLKTLTDADLAISR